MYGLHFKSANRRSILLSLSVAGCLISSISQAQTASTLLWKNAQGFTAAQGCTESLRPIDEISLRVLRASAPGATYTELTIEKDGAKPKLRDRSVVRLTEKPVQNGAREVDVMGISQNPGAAPSDPVAVRMNRGLVPDVELQSIALHAFELKEGVPAVTFGTNGIATLGKFLRLSSVDNNKYASLACGKGNETARFILFDVFESGKKAAIARIGVNTDATNIFRGLRTYTAKEADTLLAAPATAPNKPGKPSLQPDSLRVRKANVTFYNPNSNSRLEGGPRTRFGETINAVSDSIKNGRPVTVAADYMGSFGAECNQLHRRCLMLVKATGFDRLFPEYRKKFPHLPKNTFIGIIEDTGGAFFHTAGRRFDLAIRNSALARALPSWFDDDVKWIKLKNPCGTKLGGRECVLNERPLAPEIVSTIEK